MDSDTTQPPAPPPEVEDTSSELPDLVGAMFAEIRRSCELAYAPMRLPGLPRVLRPYQRKAR